MKIEHWHSQSPSKYPEEQLDYTNLLGACKGNEGQPRAKQHCDSRKADQHLSRNPANPAHAVEDFIRFEFDGSIASTGPIFDTEPNAVLNLNLAFLKNNRKVTLDAFKVLLGKDGRLERHLQKWNGELDSGALQPYCQVVVYWLRKRLRP